MKKRALILVLLAFISLGGGVGYAQSQRTVIFQATINPGALLTDVRDQFGRSILQPILSMGKVINSVQCRTGEGSLNGVLGSNVQRIYVDNPKAAFDGWTLSLSPKDGDEAKWQGNEGYSFDFNDSGSQGCTDSDQDGQGGLLSIDPSNAQLQSDCLECSVSNITLGSIFEQSFDEVRAVTLLKASDSSDELGSWYMTNVKVRQSVPAGQEGDDYKIDMVLTATAT